MKKEGIPPADKEGSTEAAGEVSDEIKKIRRTERNEALVDFVA